MSEIFFSCPYVFFLFVPGNLFPALHAAVCQSASADAEEAAAAFFMFTVRAFIMRL